MSGIPWKESELVFSLPMRTEFHAWASLAMAWLSALVVGTVFSRYDYLLFTIDGLSVWWAIDIFVTSYNRSGLRIYGGALPHLLLTPLSKSKTEGIHHTVFLRPLRSACSNSANRKIPTSIILFPLLYSLFFKFHSFIIVSRFFLLLFFSFIRCLLFLYSMYLQPYHTTLRYKNRLKRWQAFGHLQGNRWSPPKVEWQGLLKIIPILYRIHISISVLNLFFIKEMWSLHLET